MRGMSSGIGPASGEPLTSSPYPIDDRSDTTLPSRVSSRSTGRPSFRLVLSAVYAALELVSGVVVSHRRLVAHRLIRQEHCRGDEHACRALAALHCVELDEGLLQWSERIALLDAFDGRDLHPRCLLDGQQ